MTLPSFHVKNQMLQTLCYERPDYIQIRYQGMEVAICCKLGHAIQTFDTENLDAARKAIKDGNDKLADRHAQLAQLDAELAVSKSQSASARKAADELLASIKTLRQEAERPTAPTDSQPRTTDDQ